MRHGLEDLGSGFGLTRDVGHGRAPFASFPCTIGHIAKPWQGHFYSTASKPADKHGFGIYPKMTFDQFTSLMAARPLEEEE